MPKKLQNASQESFQPIEVCPPAADELEVSLFGPGIGECIVAHLGNGKWMIVDSCLEPSTKEPMPLQYLNKMGVNPASSVDVVVISHWHDDHILGAAKTLSACESAKVCYPMALLLKEFLTLAKALSGSLSIVDRQTSGIREMASIIRALESAHQKQPNIIKNRLSPTRADQILYQHNNDNCQIEVRALSPSDASINNAIQEFATLIPSFGDERRVIPRPTQNHNAIVIWIRFGDNRVLLGSDLEETADPYTGWSVIVNSSLRPDGRAKLFKVPHHGSRSGHSGDVWNNMVEKNATGILTTYGRGRTPTPQPTDVLRMKRLTSDLYCTSEPKAALPRRDNAVERTLKGMVKKRKVFGGDIGHIQVRMKLTSEIRINIKPPAIKL